MKRLITMAILLLGMLLPALLTMQSASAVDVLTGPNGPCSSTVVNKPLICNDDSTNSTNNPIFGPSGIVTVAVRILSLIVGFLAIVFIIVQAIKLAASGGDSQAVASARSGIIYALVGLVVSVMAQVLVDLVLSKLT
ncbi:MAG TPA: hypothetical protein VMR95_03755 [Candidatus Binatia bacterium]|jgi:hypothetical protein|nr:hypothetical protein [Candidatus Binatia bacterium]